MDSYWWILRDLSATVQILVNPQNEGWDDDHENVFFEGDTDQFDARSKWNGEHADGKGVPIPDVGQRIQNEDSFPSAGERIRSNEQPEGERSEHQFADNIRVWSEHRADVREHVRCYDVHYKKSRQNAHSATKFKTNGRVIQNADGYL
jgi:Zn ribbon nucleic-acid-binding protein